MNRLWKKEYTLRAGDFDKYNRIKPSSVLDLFQDAAGRHAEELGLGFKEMYERSYIWVLTRVKFQILSQPERNSDVIIKTWPLEPNRFNYRREYSMEDKNGKKIIIGSSEWVVVHSEKRRLLSVPDLYPFSDGFHDEKMFEGKLGKVEDFTVESTPYSVRASFCELDVNNHVNNTRYANYVLDAISPQKDDTIESLQIDYRKEVIEGTELNILYTKLESEILAKGQNSDGDIMFGCKIKLK